MAFLRRGFRNNQDTLLLTPQMMETYFEIAEKALDLCLVDDTKKPEIQSFRVELGSGINKQPVPENVQLNGPALLPKTNFQVRQLVPDKPFSFDPFAMQTRFRFIEGYRGNHTARAWKEFEGLYHSVFAGMIGSHTKGGYNYGRSSHMDPEGLLPPTAGARNRTERVAALSGTGANVHHAHARTAQVGSASNHRGSRPL